MTGELLSVDEVADRLGCGSAEALELIRRVGPAGAVRTNDRRFLVPAQAVELLRLAKVQG